MLSNSTHRLKTISTTGICLTSIWTAAPTVAPSGLGGGGGDRHELIITWTVSQRVIL